MNDSTSRALSQPSLEPELRASVEANEANACVIAAVLGARLVPRMPRAIHMRGRLKAGRVVIFGTFRPRVGEMSVTDGNDNGPTEAA